MRAVSDAWVWLRQRWEVRAADAKIGSGGECMAFHFPFRIALASIVATTAWVGPLEAQGTSSSNLATIYISRPTQFAGAGLSVDVQVDGKSVGSISNGGCMRLRLPAGRHTVSGGNMWGGIFSGGGRRVARLQVGPGGSIYVLITPTVLPGYNFMFPATVMATGRRC